MATWNELIRTIERQGIQNPAVLKALRATDRARYVPPGLERHAYLDQPLPIPHHQVTSQPSLVARMVEGLGLRSRDRVLEVGTGYGYQTALLARLAGFVWSVERWPDLAEAARANLARDGIDNVEIVVGDGTAGLPEKAPFDAVVVSAAFTEVPAPLSEQLVVGGRLVQPIGPGGEERVILFERTAAGLAERAMLSGARFVRLYGAHGFPEPGDSAAGREA